MAHIIKEGNPDKLSSWVTTCSNCGCEYSFSMKDFHPVYDPGSFGKDDVKYYVQCPFCGKWRRSSTV